MKKLSVERRLVVIYLHKGNLSKTRATELVIVNQKHEFRVATAKTMRLC